MSYEERRELIQKVLSPLPDDMPGANAIAARALWSWEQVFRHIQPLIGEAGFLALYARTVHLTDARPVPLTPVRQSAPVDAVLGQLKADLERLTPALAAQASNMLLDTFTDLLSTMIGESLTSRILHSAWARKPRSTNAEENKQ